MTLNRRELLQIAPLALAGITPAAGRRPVVGRHRARELGVTIGRLAPGAWNAITDVPGVKVGHVTLVSGEGELVVGRGPVRTGVTAVWPHAGIVEAPALRVRRAERQR